MAVSTTLVAQEGAIPNELWNRAFSGTIDTAASRAFETIVSDYWTTTRDSIPLYISRAETYLAEAKATSADDLSVLRIELCAGQLYKHNQEPTRAIQHYFAALMLAEKLSQPTYITKINLEIGLIYYLQANWEKAVDFFNAALRANTSAKNVRRENILTYLIGLSLNNSGRYAEALPLFRRIYDFNVSARDTNRMLEAGTGLADAYRGTGRLDSAESIYRHILEVADAAGGERTDFHAVVHAGLARLYMDMGRLDDSEREALASLTYSRKHDYFIPKLEAQKTLYNIYRQRGDHTNALHYLELYTHDYDSLQNKDNIAKMSVSQALFEYQHKEDAIVAEEGKKQTIMITVASLTSLLVLVVIFFYRSLSKQKARSELLLENILPKDTIAELKERGGVIPRIHHNVTIMFCDVKDFTVLAEDLSPESLVQLLDLYFRKFDEIISVHGLEKIKTIGDAYMATGGLHDSSQNYAERCIMAAQQMIQYVAETSDGFRQQFGHSFTFRIGIHTGSVVSGVVGRDKYAYDVWGDTVNTASRIEQHSEPGRINLSGSTYDMVRTTVPCIYRGKISAKNKGDVDMYFVET
jgi:class 3 adenylate cyclase/lipopolysaccharide biosynthesis regulator YciM